MRQLPIRIKRWNQNLEINSLTDFGWDPKVGHDERILSGFSLNLDVISVTVAPSGKGLKIPTITIHWLVKGWLLIDFTTWTPKC